jgi:hypothetical protein
MQNVPNHRLKGDRTQYPFTIWPLLTYLFYGGQGRNRTADASLFRAAYRQLHRGML